jgi:flavodoxin
MSKIGIYFTIRGNNKKVASEMAKKENYEIIEFAPGNIMRVFQFFLGKKRLSKKAKELQSKLMEHEDIIIHGPIWGGKPAPAVLKLLENLEFTGKNVSCHFTYTQNYGDTEKLVTEIIQRNNGLVKLIDFTNISQKSLELEK